MAIALPQLAAETIFTPSNRERIALTGRNAHQFALSAHELFTATASSDRRLVASDERAVTLTERIFAHASEHFFDMTKPAMLDDDHRDGLYTWSKWMLSQGPLRDELKMVRPSLRHEHIAIMARRDILAQRAQQLSGYLSMAEYMGDDYASLSSILNEQQVAEFGFGSYQELADFSSEFTAITETTHYRYIYSSEIQAGMANAYEPDKAARTALFSFFYLNRLFPPDAVDEYGRNARSIALRRLGLSQETQYLDIGNREDRNTLQAVKIGREFSHLNSTYVRDEHAQDVVYAKSKVVN